MARQLGEVATAALGEFADMARGFMDNFQALARGDFAGLVGIAADVAPFAIGGPVGAVLGRVLDRAPEAVMDLGVDMLQAELANRAPGLTADRIEALAKATRTLGAHLAN